MVLDDDACDGNKRDVDEIRACEDGGQEAVKMRDEPFDDHGVAVILVHFFIDGKAVDGCDSGFRSRKEADETKQENQQDDVCE